LHDRRIEPEGIEQVDDVERGFAQEAAHARDRPSTPYALDHETAQALRSPMHLLVQEARDLAVALRTPPGVRAREHGDAMTPRFEAAGDLARPELVSADELRRPEVADEQDVEAFARTRHGAAPTYRHGGGAVKPKTLATVSRSSDAPESRCNVAPPARFGRNALAS
jgi:hypothetical protein